MRSRFATIAAVVAIAAAATVHPGTWASAAPPDPEAGIPIPTAAPGSTQGNAAVAFNGDVYLVVWEEAVAGSESTAIHGVRVSNGGALIGSPFRISDPDEFDRHIDPAVASDGDDFMIVYRTEPIDGSTYGDLDAAIVGGDGSIVRDPWGFRYVDNDQLDPVIAWNGKRYLAVWEDGPDPSDPDIFGARAFSDGKSWDGCSAEKCVGSEYDWPGIEIHYTEGSDPITSQRRPTVTASRGTFFIAWEDDTSGDLDISGARLRNGRTLDDPPYAVVAAPGAQAEPAIGANGRRVLTAWTDDRSGGGTDIRAVLNHAEIVVTSAPGTQSAPAVTTRGDGFLIAWVDTRSGGADIYAGRVNGAGVVRDGDGVAIASSDAVETEPALAAGRNNRQLLAYTEGDVASRVVVTLID